jgi:hypothetical protein
VRIHYRVPVGRAQVLETRVNGAAAQARIEPGVGGAFLDVTGPEGNRADLRLRLRHREVTARSRPVVAQGEEAAIDIAGVPAIALEDPQGVLAQPRLTGQSVLGKVGGTLGPHTLFVRAGAGDDSWWEPVDIEVRAPVEIANTRPEFASGACRFTLRNNTARELKAAATAAWTGRTTPLAVSIAPQAEQEFTVEGSAGELLLGKNRLKIGGLPGSGPISTEVLYWPESAPTRPADRWQTVRLESFYNDSLATILSRPFWTSDYPSAVCCDYMLDHLIGRRNRVPDDSRLRSRVDAQGIFLTRYGIPFAQRAQGNNMVALGRWKDLPDNIEIPLEGAARRLYLLLSGITFPMQSHIANARVTLFYGDGGTTVLDLVNPGNFDNGWGKPGGTHHYAANGGEVIGETPPQSGEPATPKAWRNVILRQHGIPEPFVQPEWELPDLPPHADIVDIACDPGRNIRQVKVEVLSNEIIVGLLGVTLLR